MAARPADIAAYLSPAAGASPPHISIFSPQDYRYLRVDLQQSPLRTVDANVDFEHDIPPATEPPSDWGKSLRCFYDAVVLKRTEPLPEHKTRGPLALLNAAQDKLPQDVRLVLRHYTYVDYLIAMGMRAKATDRTGVETAELADDPSKGSFWGSNRQLMFGKVVADIFNTNYPTRLRLHPLTGVFACPAGGIIGAGTRNWWAEHIGHNVFGYSRRVLNNHAVCHDASGYCRTALDIGVGYTYITGPLTLCGG
jgi:hypothetical protein